MGTHAGDVDGTADRAAAPAHAPTVEPRRRGPRRSRHPYPATATVSGHPITTAHPSSAPVPRASPGEALSELSEQALRDQIGRVIRELRHDQDLTLVQLARLSDLSHSFLSQLERGRARPSMQSLHRIALALGTTQPALMSMAATGSGAAAQQPAADVSLVRAGGGVPVDNTGGQACSLVTGVRAMYPVLFEGGPSEFGPAYSHPGDEFVFVVAGSIEMEVAGSCPMVLHPGDTLYYPGGLAHRWRQLPGPTAQVLLVQDGRAGAGWGSTSA